MKIELAPREWLEVAERLVAEIKQLEADISGLRDYNAVLLKALEELFEYSCDVANKTEENIPPPLWDTVYSAIAKAKEAR